MKEHITVPWITHPWVTEGQNKARFGVGMVHAQADWSVFHDGVQMAEELGFDSYWAFDHPLYFVDCWMTLATLAMTTKTVRLGSIVTRVCPTWPPCSKCARTTAGTRRSASSSGRLVGGGERVTWRQVAQYADVSNFGAHAWTGSAFQSEDVVRKFEALDSHCEAMGRPSESVLRSYLSFPLVLAETHHALRAKLDAIPEDARAFFHSSLIAGTPSEIIVHYQSLIDAGVQYFIVTLLEQDLETLQLLAEQVMPILVQAKKA